MQFWPKKTTLQINLQKNLIKVIILLKSNNLSLLCGLHIFHCTKDEVFHEGFLTEEILYEKLHFLCSVHALRVLMNACLQALLALMSACSCTLDNIFLR